MSNHTRYAFVTLLRRAVFLFAFAASASSLGCASTTTAYTPEPRNIAGTAQTQHAEPLRMRESTVHVEHSSAASSGHSMGMARRVRAR
jgi:hypothetical protein